MVEQEVFLVPTLSAWTSAREDQEVMATMPDHLKARLLEAHETHVAMLRNALRLSVPIAMGTDAGTPGNHHGANALECVAMVEEAGMRPDQSVRAATLNAARLLGREQELGSIEPGRLADIIGVPANPFGDIRALADVRFVMKGGETVNLASD